MIATGRELILEALEDRIVLDGAVQDIPQEYVDFLKALLDVEDVPQVYLDNIGLVLGDLWDVTVWRDYRPVMIEWSATEPVAFIDSFQVPHFETIHVTSQFDTESSGQRSQAVDEGLHFGERGLFRGECQEDVHDRPESGGSLHLHQFPVERLSEDEPAPKDHFLRDFW
jgi:hypothetical protein